MEAQEPNTHIYKILKPTTTTLITRNPVSAVARPESAFRKSALLRLGNSVCSVDLCYRFKITDLISESLSSESLGHKWIQIK